MAAPTLPVPPAGDLQADVYAWTGVVARSRLPMNIKIIAFTVTTFANGNGSRVFPGITWLMVRTGLSRSTVSRALGQLRDVGLLELVRKGNRRRRHADEYRLILAEDLLDRLDLPSLEEERAEVDAENERHRAASATRQHKRRSTVSIEAVEHPAERPVDNPPESPEKSITSTVTAQTDETRFYGQRDPRSTVTALTPHLRIEHLPRKTTHGSSMAGDQPSAAARRHDGHQSPLMGVIDGDQPDHPIDDHQLTIPVPIPAPADPDRDTLWPVIADQLARINAHTSTGATA